MGKIGTLGGGNHFISIEKGKTGTYLIIHTGSRNFGKKLAIHFQKIAIEENCYGEGEEKVLIPLNMADGSLICIGKGNPDWNNSAPHGAGRALSRTQAKDKLNMKEYKRQMKNIYSNCVSISTLDESPMAYKNSDEIIKAIDPTAEIIDHLKPLYNFKAEE